MYSLMGAPGLIVFCAPALSGSCQGVVPRGRTCRRKRHTNPSFWIGYSGRSGTHLASKGKGECTLSALPAQFHLAPGGCPGEAIPGRIGTPVWPCGQNFAQGKATSLPSPCMQGLGSCPLLASTPRSTTTRHPQNLKQIALSPFCLYLLV
jgi:hypothetical protein